MSTRERVSEPLVLPHNAGEAEAASDYLKEHLEQGFVDWPEPDRAFGRRMRILRSLRVRPRRASR